jgi:hypothetical protein
MKIPYRLALFLLDSIRWFFIDLWKILNIHICRLFISVSTLTFGLLFFFVQEEYSINMIFGSLVAGAYFSLFFAILVISLFIIIRNTFKTIKSIYFFIRYRALFSPIIAKDN